MIKTYYFLELGSWTIYHEGESKVRKSGEGSLQWEGERERESENGGGEVKGKGREREKGIVEKGW